MITTIKKRKQNFSRLKRRIAFVIQGFKFIVTEGDYDYFDAKSLPCRFNPANISRFEALKEKTEHDYIYTDYDCNGSTRVWVEMERQKNNMIVLYHWRKDV